jgi:hypothetical protein
VLPGYDAIRDQARFMRLTRELKLSASLRSRPPTMCADTLGQKILPYRRSGSNGALVDRGVVFVRYIGDGTSCSALSSAGTLRIRPGTSKR